MSSSAAKAESSAESGVRRASRSARSRRAEASWLLVALLSLAAGAVLFLARERGRTDSTARPEVATEHEPPAEEPAVRTDRARVEPPPLAEHRSTRVAVEDLRPPAELAHDAESATAPAESPETGVLEVLVRSDGIAVPATIELGHNLDLRVVAEGVENERIWDGLARLGCDTAQGYFVSRPMPAERFREWESASRWHH